MSNGSSTFVCSSSPLYFNYDCPQSFDCRCLLVQIGKVVSGIMYCRPELLIGKVWTFFCSLSLFLLSCAMSLRPSAVPSSQPRSVPITPPPCNEPKQDAKEQFARLFATVSTRMAVFLNSKTPEEHQINGKTLDEPLVRS